MLPWKTCLQSFSLYSPSLMKASFAVADDGSNKKNDFFSLLSPLRQCVASQDRSGI